MLFLSELETGRAVVALGSIRALPVIEQVVAERWPTAPSAPGVELAVDVHGVVRAAARAAHAAGRRREPRRERDPLRGHGRACTVTRARGDGGAAPRSSSDDGAGVAEEDLPRLFERFYRADRARSTRGTGLGLAIVKHVVTAAGGTVEATPTPGGGLTVTLHVPAPRL